MVHAGDRYQVFQAAWRLTGWSLEELWIGYLANNGTASSFELDAYLAGLGPLSSGEQDVLACTLNERFQDLGETRRVPFTTRLPDEDALLPLLEELVKGRVR